MSLHQLTGRNLREADVEIRDVLTIIALILGPISATMLALWVEARRREQNQKDARRLDVLYDLVRARAGFNTQRNRDVLESAFNAIPIIFRDSEAVCAAHRLAFQSKGTPDFEGALLDLVIAVCDAMNYKNVDRDTVLGIFIFPE